MLSVNEKMSFAFVLRFISSSLVSYYFQWLYAVMQAAIRRDCKLATGQF